MPRTGGILVGWAGRAACVAVLALAGCEQAEQVYYTATLTNISLDRSPNLADAGRIDQKREQIEMRLGSEAVIAGFRASGCGEPAPDFADMMRDLVTEGLRVPDGLVLFDAGVGHYRSQRCGGQAHARAIGAYGAARGTYQLSFFGGETKRTVVVR